MFKQFILISLILSALLFSEMTSQCFADVSAQLKQAREYNNNGYLSQAEDIYKAIVQNNPGTDYALTAQKELVLMYLKIQAMWRTEAGADILTALNKLQTFKKV